MKVPALNERGRQLRRPLARTLEYVAPCDQYDRDQDNERYRYLADDAVKKAALFRVTSLHCHNYLLGWNPSIFTSIVSTLWHRSQR